ncbi:MAG TPA: amino acid synthesis family protein [Rhizobiaceae bacterium]|nr:amino acid synthesis family protein [Rhizobiaceae bacterium]
MHPSIRKTVVSIEDVHHEGGKAVPRPFRMVTAAAVVTNPWAGKGFVEDLQPVINALAPEVAQVLVAAAMQHMSKDEVEAYGKAAIVGTSGEVEHASALIHSLRFGNVLRDAAGGTSFLPFTNKRGGPGSCINVPMKNKAKEQEGSRAHFLTAEIVVPDAPAHDEIVVAIAIACSGRPHHRIGDRYIDMKEMAEA